MDYFAQPYQMFPNLPGGMLTNVAAPMVINNMVSNGLMSQPPLFVGNGSFADAFAARYNDQVANQSILAARGFDNDKITQALHGIVRASGRDVTPEMQYSLYNIANAGTGMLGPMMARSPYFRDRLDELTGGVSSMNLASSLAYLNRSQYDPLTGRIGATATFNAQTANRMAGFLNQPSALNPLVRGNYGFRGDDIGYIMAQMQQSGALPNAMSYEANMLNPLFVNSVKSGTYTREMAAASGRLDQYDMITSTANDFSAGALSRSRDQFNAMEQNRLNAMQGARQTSNLALDILSQNTKLSYAKLDGEDPADFTQRLLEIGSKTAQHIGFDKDPALAQDLNAALTALRAGDKAGFEQTGFGRMSKEEQLDYISQLSGTDSASLNKMVRANDLDSIRKNLRGGSADFGITEANIASQADAIQKEDFLQNDPNGQTLQKLNNATADRMASAVSNRARTLAAVKEFLNHRGLSTAIEDVAKTTEAFLGAGNDINKLGVGAGSAGSLIKRADMIARNMNMTAEQMGAVMQISQGVVQQMGFTDSSAGLVVGTNAATNINAAQNMGAFNDLRYGDANKDQILQYRIGASAAAVKKFAGQQAGVLARLESSGAIQSGAAGDQLKAIIQGYKDGTLSEDQLALIQNKSKFLQLASEATGGAFSTGVLSNMLTETTANENAMMRNNMLAGNNQVQSFEALNKVGGQAINKALLNQGFDKGAATKLSTALKSVLDDLGTEGLKDPNSAVAALKDKLQAQAASGDAEAAALLGSAGFDAKIKATLQGAESVLNPILATGSKGVRKEEARLVQESKAQAFVNEVLSTGKFGGAKSTVDILRELGMEADPTKTLGDAAAAAIGLDTGGTGAARINQLVNLMGQELAPVNKEIEALESKGTLSREEQHKPDNLRTKPAAIAGESDNLKRQLMEETAGNSKASGMLKKALEKPTASEVAAQDKAQATATGKDGSGQVANLTMQNVTLVLDGVTYAQANSGSTRGTRSTAGV